MRARALSRPSSSGRGAPAWRGLRRPKRGALVFLRGADADARLRELEAVRRAARPLLGELAGVLVEGRLHEALGYRTLGDYGRERLGVGARAVREWARVWRRLAELPRLRAALLEGEISWAVARLVVGLATGALLAGLPVRPAGRDRLAGGERGGVSGPGDRPPPARGHCVPPVGRLRAGPRAAPDA